MKVRQDKLVVLIFIIPINISFLVNMTQVLKFEVLMKKYKTKLTNHIIERNYLSILKKIIVLIQ